MNKKSIVMTSIMAVVMIAALVFTAFWGNTQKQEKEALQQQLRDRMKISLEASGIQDVRDFNDYFSGQLGECEAEFTPTKEGWNTKLVKFPAIGDSADIVKLAIDYTSINELSEDVATLCYGGGKYNYKEKEIQSPY